MSIAVFVLVLLDIIINGYNGKAITDNQKLILREIKKLESEIDNNR